MLGTEPTVIRACEPSTSRPSDSVTRTPSAVATTLSARERGSMVTPRSVNTSSSVVAASGSSCGRTRSRLEISVTGTPSSAYAETNSAPVTPEPTTMRCSGSASRS